MKTLVLAAAIGLAHAEAGAGPDNVAPGSGSVHRFALIVGANDGGRDRTRLRYATDDADTFARAVSQLGGVHRRDQVLLQDPSAAQLEAGFGRMSARIRAAQSAGERVQFLFYYSGHSDEQGLLLEGTRVDYRRLRGLIDGVPAKVKIGILDSCASGAFTRLKGGQRTAPFLAGSAASVTGHAFLTSSSSDEAAQESDRIGGSFFTHFLVTGLRGAADVNSDGFVTLNEVYRFAYDETLERTEATQGGAQHAAYDIRLAGTGDLVMTDLRETSATLRIEDDVQGRIYVRDAKGRLAAELYKPAGSGPTLLALEPGTYHITVDSGTGLRRGRVSLRDGAQGRLQASTLRDVAPEATTARGEGGGEGEDDRPLGRGADYRVIGFSMGLFPPLTINDVEKDKKVINYVGVNWVMGHAAGIRGVEVALGANWVDEFVHGAQGAIGANIVGGEVKGAQSAVGANIVSGPVHGVQTAVGANLAGGEVRGIQGAVGANVAREPVTGIQAAVGANLAGKELEGLQVGVGGSWTPKLRGAQMTLVNAADEVRGAQLGLVNVAKGRVHGVQVGLVNYADEADASIGLIGMTKKGGVWADVWTSDVAAVHVGVRFRARHTYTFLTGGAFPAGSGAAWMAGLGFGGSWKLPHKLYLEADVSGQTVFPGFIPRSNAPLLGSVRLMLGYRFARRFALFGGPTVRTLVDFESGETADDIDRPGYQYSVSTPHHNPGGVGVRLWPGFVFGLEI